MIFIVSILPKNVSINPSLIVAFEEGFDPVGTDLNNPSPSYLGIYNEVIPNKVFHVGLMPLFMVEFNALSFRSIQILHMVMP